MADFFAEYFDKIYAWLYNLVMDKINIIKSKFLKNMFDQNTYIISNENEAVIIDAGAELEDVKEIVGNKKVLAVLVSHIHFDHIWNIEKYTEEFDCDVYIVEGFEEKFFNPEYNCSTIVKQEIKRNIPKNKIKYYKNNLKLGMFEFDIIQTPGHSADSVCILLNKYLFSGDTLFADGVGRTDLYDSDSDQLINSLNKIMELNFVILYPGHYIDSSKENVKKFIKYYI